MRLRRARRAGLILLASGIAYALIGIPLFIAPPQDPLPPRADVVLVLGPAREQRRAIADALLEQGVVAHELISIPTAATVASTPDARRWAACPSWPDVTCRIAEPHTTQGEARMLARLAERNGWRSVIVVTQSAHLLRARAIIARCFPGRITMRASGEPPQGGWLYQYGYQTTATVKSWFVPPDC